jgi:hypothetical protein
MLDAFWQLSKNQHVLVDAARMAYWLAPATAGM